MNLTSISDVADMYSDMYLLTQITTILRVSIAHERRFIFTALQEKFITYLKVYFFAAFFVTSPFILIQVWKFIAPGLYNHEKKEQSLFLYLPLIYQKLKLHLRGNIQKLYLLQLLLYPEQYQIFPSN